MSKLQLFQNQEFGNVRVIVKDEEPWFIAKDVSQILGYTKLDSMYRRIDEDDILKINPQDSQYQGFPQNGGILEPNPNVTILAIINESGLYSAILGSKLDSAKKFKKWVTSEVLPSIRKHGAYMTSETLEMAISNPDFTIGILTALKIEKEKIKRLEPKAESYDKFINAENYQSVGDVAKVLGYGRNRLFEILRRNKVLQKDSNVPYQRYIEQELFVVREGIMEKGSSIFNVATTYVTPKGVTWIEKLLTARASNLLIR